MGNSNRANGTSFERRLCIALAIHGFWAHNLAQNQQGQPFDVIAARNGETYIIDCKQCQNDCFLLSRIEENQRSSMMLWRDTGNGDGWFALEMSDGEVFMVRFSVLVAAAARGVSRLQRGAIETMCLTFDEWVEQCG